MPTAEQSVDVDVPVHTAYNQWTQFEEFPQFMTDVETVEQVDDRNLHWIVRIAGVEREFDAEIVEQHPEERISWRALHGVKHSGVVTFHKIDEQRTRVMLQLEMAPEDEVEAAAEMSGIVAAAAKRDMQNFKEFVENRGFETGAWRCEVPREG